MNFTADPAAWHLLLMTDPDAPSRQYPKLREVQHWLVGNIPGFNVSAGEVLSEYLAPEPAPGTGLHRCVDLPRKLNRHTITVAMFIQVLIGITSH